MNDRTGGAAWREVLDFWFPEGRSIDVDAESHRRHWAWRMHGGADDAIIARFSDLTECGTRGELDGWASDPEGRLALIIVLDQFSRSLWRGMARAFAQDRVALALAMEGLANGHFAALDVPWFKVVHTQPLGHCEGPDHRGRLDLLVNLRTEIAAATPAHLQPLYQSLVKQAEDVRKVIAAFGRHPHRNQALGRASTLAEDAYVTRGDFPHMRAFQE